MTQTIKFISLVSKDIFTRISILNKSNRNNGFKKFTWIFENVEILLKLKKPKKKKKYAK